MMNVMQGENQAVLNVEVWLELGVLSGLNSDTERQQQSHRVTNSQNMCKQELDPIVIGPRALFPHHQQSSLPMILNSTLLVLNAEELSPKTPVSYSSYWSRNIGELQASFHLDP